MSTKTIVLSIAAALAVGLAVGRYSLPAKVVVKTETVEVDKKQSDTATNKDDHSITTVTVTKHADGTVTTVTVIKKDVQTVTDSKQIEQDSKDVKSLTETTYNTEKWMLSGLALTKPLSNRTLTYGGQIQYRILGPFQVGLLGVADGTVGVSFGITF